MIVTVDTGTPAEIVRRALVERGLWVRSYLEVGSSGHVRFFVQGGSRTVPASELLAISGVAAVADIEPTGDIHGSSEYRINLIRVLTERAVLKASERAGGG